MHARPALSESPRKILCVEPSSTQRAIMQQIAERHRLACVLCAGEAEALALLGDAYSMMMVANELQEGDSFRLIEAVRVSPRHATMPIAFVTANEDRFLSHGALKAGATEVFLRGDPDALSDFLAGCASDLETVALGGRVLLVEDSPSQAEYVAHLCGMLGLAVDRCASVADALACYVPGKYLLVIVDIILDDIQSGIALVRHIRQNRADRQHVLVMSSFNDIPRRLLALKSGADDFISKPFPPEELVWRMKRIFGAVREPLLRPDVDVPEAGVEPRDQLQMLTPREREITQKILEGLTDKVIARDLGISFWTVRSHVEQIFTKTGALNRRDLMARFISQ